METPGVAVEIPSVVAEKHCDTVACDPHEIVNPFSSEH